MLGIIKTQKNYGSISNIHKNLEMIFMNINYK